MGIEWKIPTHHIHAYIERGGYDDPDLSIGVACGLFAVWVSLEHCLPKRFHKWWNPYSNKELKLSFSDGSLRWCIWMDDNEWQSSTPWWRQGSFNPADFLLGKQNYEKQTLSTTEAVVPMPEGEYPATVEIFRSTWKRPRWPFTKQILRASVELKTPIPVPGKGENSWDCDDDAIYSLTAPANTVEEAIAACVRSAMRDRERYADVDWIPGGAR